MKLRSRSSRATGPKIRVPRGMEPSEVEALVLADETVKARLEGLSVKKIVVVKDRIVNLVAG